MRLLATEYSLRHKALELYLAGCRGPHCEGCHNPESWDFESGSPLWPLLPEIEAKLSRFANLVDRVWILGGEPLDQDHEQLRTLLEVLRRYDKEIWLWTRYPLKEVPASILDLCDFIKVGRYVPALATETNTRFGVRLASSNQAIFQVRSN